MKAKSIRKWLVRLPGLAISSAYLAFMIGEGLDGLYENADPIIYVFFSLMTVSIVGYAVSWYSEGIGGALMIVGGLLMLSFHLLRQDIVTAMVYGTPFIVLGLLSGVSAYEKNADSKRTHKLHHV